MAGRGLNPAVFAHWSEMCQLGAKPTEQQQHFPCSSNISVVWQQSDALKCDDEASVSFQTESCPRLLKRPQWKFPSEPTAPPGVSLNYTDCMCQCSHCNWSFPGKMCFCFQLTAASWTGGFLFVMFVAADEGELVSAENGAGHTNKQRHCRELERRKC